MSAGRADRRDDAAHQRRGVGVPNVDLIGQAILMNGFNDPKYPLASYMQFDKILCKCAKSYICLEAQSTVKPPQIVNRRVKGSFGVFLSRPRISLFLSPIAAGFALLRSFLNNGQMVDRTAIIEKDIAILRIRCPSAERGRASLPRPPAHHLSLSPFLPPPL